MAVGADEPQAATTRQKATDSARDRPSRRIGRVRGTAGLWHATGWLPMGRMSGFTMSLS